MALILAYSLRNLLARRLTAVLTAGGMALVVFVFAAILMLAEGLERALVDSGSPENAVVLRKGSNSEVQSPVAVAEAAIVESLPGIAAGADGRPLVARELVVLIQLPRRGGEGTSNVTLRGVSERSLRLRPQVRLAAGREPQPGLPEVVVGQGASQRFAGAGLHEELAFANRTWRVVGLLDAGNTAFDSEIWADADLLLQAFRRRSYSSVLLRLEEPGRLEELRGRLEGDPRLSLEVKREIDYYREQSEATATFLRILGTALAAIFSVGAVVGAMITLYAAVAHRTAEIGILRALGFPRGVILAAFLTEAVFLGLAGGLAGMLAAAGLEALTVSTTNFQTFSEVVFRFRMSGPIALEALGFALLMGLAGGLLPALRAARMNLLEALGRG